MLPQQTARIIKSVLPVVLGYAFIASLWIVGSDQVVTVLVPTPEPATEAQTLKGLGFVFVTTMVLFLLLLFQFRRLLVADALLQRQRQFFLSLLGSSSDYIVQVDDALRICYANAAFTALFTGALNKARIYGISGLAAQEKRKLQACIGQVFATNEQQELELTINLNADTKYLIAHIYPEDDSERPVKSVLIVMRDVTELQRALNASRVTEARLQGLIDSQVDLLCRYTPDTTLTFVNDAYSRFFQKPQENLLGTRFLDWADAGTHASIQERIATVLQDPAPESTVMYAPDNEGNTRWIQWVDHGITNESGRVVEIQAVGRDITIQKLVELELQRINHLLQTIIDNIPVMIAFFDAAGNFEFVNQHWVDCLGWTVEDLREHNDPLSLFYPDPVTKESVLAYMLAAAPGWREFETHTGYGHKLITSWANVKLPDGRSIGIGQDVTERKTAEQALRSSEKRFRKAIEEAPFPILIHAEDGEIQTISRTWTDLTGYTLSQLPTVKAWTRLAYRGEDYQQKVEQGIDQLFEVDGRVDEGEFLIHCHDGTQRIWEFSSTSLGRLTDERRLVISMATDVTSRNQREQERESLIHQLEARTAELERFTYTVSHDLKSPLITIQGFLGVLQEDLKHGTPEQIADDFNEIARAADSMQELLQDLLDLSRIGRLVNPSEHTPAAAVIDEALARVTGSLKAHEVEVSVQPDLPIIYGDKNRLIEVFQNLIENAIKFSNEDTKARIQIGTCSDPAKHIFFVQDNGKGIAADYHEKVFGLFERLDHSTEGTGIGLALVKRIVEFHDGQVWVESEGVGCGSTFYIALPKVEDDLGYE